MAGEKILIVEDESVVALNIQMRLEAAHYQIAGVADSRQTALALLKDTCPDLVLLDIRLKNNQSGVRVAQEIREHCDVPIIYLTAYADPGTLQQAYQTTPYGCILKPFDVTELYSTIALALNHHQVQSRLQSRNQELESQVQRRTQELEQATQHLQQEMAERQRAESAVQQALERQQEYSELKTRFITTASHEFRTPLSIVMTSAELIERMGDHCSEERRIGYLQKIQQAVRSMTTILTELLTLSKANSGALEFHPIRIDLPEFCAHLLTDMSLGADSSPALQWEIVSDNTIEATLDPNLLTLILTNLLSNAVKFSPRGSSIYLEAQCPAADDPEFVRFRLQDHGIGIPVEDFPHVFESFHRATNVDTIPGIGLGLAIVHQCVDLHHGQITIQSEVNQGTIVVVKLPIMASQSVATFEMSQSQDIERV